MWHSNNRQVPIPFIAGTPSREPISAPLPAVDDKYKSAYTHFRGTPVKGIIERSRVGSGFSEHCYKISYMVLLLLRLYTHTRSREMFPISFSIPSGPPVPKTRLRICVVFHRQLNSLLLKYFLLLVPWAGIAQSV